MINEEYNQKLSGDSGYLGYFRLTSDNFILSVQSEKIKSIR